MYEQFEPNENRNYRLIVCDGLAYRDELDLNDYDPKAMEILDEATRIIEDKSHWLATDHESDRLDGRYYVFILATDEMGKRCDPTSTFARRWTLLGALDRAAQIHYTPDSKRIAMNAMQRAIKGWISLGEYRDKPRQQEQRHDVIGIDDYCDAEMEREGHSRCLNYLNDAKKYLGQVRDKQGEQGQ